MKSERQPGMGSASIWVVITGASGPELASKNTASPSPEQRGAGAGGVHQYTRAPRWRGRSTGLERGHRLLLDAEQSAAVTPRPAVADTNQLADSQPPSPTGGAAAAASGGADRTDVIHTAVSSALVPPVI